MKGKLIIFEGIDGSGKTTIANETATKLSESGYKTIFINKKNIEFYSPYIKKFMKNLKKDLWDNTKDDPVEEVPEEAWMYLHSLWYKIMEDKLFPKLLSENDFVIIDGWYYKFLARHLVNGNFDFNYTFSIMNRFIKGDMTFFLDVSPKKCFERRTDFKPSELGAHSLTDNNKESEMSRFIEYQTKVKKEYINLCKIYNFVSIDANTDGISTIVDKICNKIKKI